MTKTNVVWQMLPLAARIKELPLLFAAALDDFADDLADELEQYMQDNAPWEDQTGAARDGLRAEAVSEKKSISIYLFHTVDYGIWLEVRWSGEYAIILPTLESEGPKVMAKFRGLMGGIK